MRYVWGTLAGIIGGALVGEALFQLGRRRYTKMWGKA